MSTNQNRSPYPYTNAYSYYPSPLPQAFSACTTSSSPLYPSSTFPITNTNTNRNKTIEKDVICIDDSLKDAIQENIPNKLKEIQQQIQEMKQNKNVNVNKKLDTIKKKLADMHILMNEEVKDQKQKEENIIIELNDIKRKLKLIDESTLMTNDDITTLFGGKTFSENISEVTTKLDTHTNKLNNIHKDVHHIVTEIIQSKQNQENQENQENDFQFDQIQNQFNIMNDSFKNQLNVINEKLTDFMQKQEANDNILILNDEKEEFRLWLEKEVKLPQYFSNFEDEGYDEMSLVSNMNLVMLEMIGINKMGHKVKIMQHIEKYKYNHPNLMYNHTVKNYFDNPKYIEIEKLSKKYKKKLKNVVNQIIKLDYSVDENLQNYYNKCDNLRDFVSNKFNQRIKKEKLKSNFIIWGDTNDNEYTKEMEDTLRNYLELNEVNCINPIILNDSHQIKQSNTIKKVFIENHSRIKKLHCEYGVVAAVNISKNTVIGEYSAKTLLKNDLNKINNQELVNDIDSYGFDADIYTEMSSKQLKQFNCTGMFNCNYDIQPPRKKQKLNNYHNKNNKNNKNNNNDKLSPQKIEIIIDGFSFKPRSLLTFINDCRETLASVQPTKDDKKYYNIKLITVFVNDWPRVFGIALRDIQPNEELLSFYGRDFIEVQNKKNKLKKRRQQIVEILSKHEIQINQF